MWRKIINIAVIIIIIGFVPQWVYSQTNALTINDCIQIAIKNNSNLKNAQRRVDIAGTNVTSARSNILPSLSASLNPSRTFQSAALYTRDVPRQNPETGEITFVQQQSITQESTTSFFTSSLSISQTIYDGGRWWNQIKQANRNYSSEEYSYENTRKQTIATLVQRYYEYIKSMKLLEVFQQAVESSREQLKKTEVMYELGAVAQADVFRGKVNLGQDMTNLISQQNIVNLNRNNLNIAMARNPGTPIEIVETNLEIEPLDRTLEETWSMAEQMNPELKSLEERMSASDYGVKMSKANFLPRITFSANYGRSNSKFDQLYSPIDKNYQIRGSISLSWNIFNGFSDAASIDRANLNYYIDRENLINRKLTLRNEIEQAFLNLQANKEIELINLDNIQSAEEDLRLNEERYRVGAGTLLEIVISRVSLTRARATLISTKYNKLIYLAELYSKIGNLEEKLSTDLN